MFENLSVFEQRCQDIDERICDPVVIADRKQYAELQRERKNLMPIVEKYREYTETQAQLDEAKSLLQEGGLDRELRELAEEQLSEARDALETITEELKILRCQSGTAKLKEAETEDGRGGRRTLPYVFTEQGKFIHNGFGF